MDLVRGKRDMSNILYLLVLAAVRLKTIGPHWTEVTDGLIVIQEKRLMVFIELMTMFTAFKNSIVVTV